MRAFAVIVLVALVALAMHKGFTLADDIRSATSARVALIDEQ